jgi:hypothetical protein
MISDCPAILMVNSTTNGLVRYFTKSTSGANVYTDVVNSNAVINLAS